MQRKLISSLVLFTFLFNMACAYGASAQTIAPYGLPQPGMLLNASKIYSYPVLKGVRIDPNNPTYLEFIIDAKDRVNIDRQELSRLVSYFLACLTIPENDLWWGKGFTEWTNVGKAKPLFFGHYQPHVPADLGYYDLRVSETRKQQADMARQFGVNGFCYWHYWFGNEKQLLEMPFKEVLKSGEPDFPFCLGWANHSWKAKNWSADAKKDKVLIEQKYPGISDCEDHFKSVLSALKDKRYMTHDGKPVFLIWEPESIPAEIDYLKIWRECAVKNGLKGITFIGFTYFKNKIDKIYDLGYDFVVYDGIVDVSKNIAKINILFKNILRKLL